MLFTIEYMLSVVTILKYVIWNSGLYQLVWFLCNILLLPTSVGHQVKVLKLQNILLPDKSKQYVIHIPSLNNFSEYNITMPKYTMAIRENEQPSYAAFNAHT